MHLFTSTDVEVLGERPDQAGLQTGGCGGVHGGGVQDADLQVSGHSLGLWSSGKVRLLVDCNVILPLVL